MITLYTPNTGFLDTDIKIAYGLARVASELRNAQWTIIPHHGYYQIDISIEFDRKNELDGAFRLLCSRTLSSETRYAVPGVSAKYRKNYMDRVSKIASSKDAITDLYQQVPPTLTGIFGVRCRHMNVESFGGKESGFILGFSGHAGKPYSRDRVGSRKNLGICVFCGALAMLGSHSCSLEVRIGNKNVTLIPVPLQRLNESDFNYLLSAVKTFPLRILDDMPCEIVPLAALALHPHLASALSSMEFTAWVHAYEQQKGSWTIRGSTIFQITPLVNFLYRKPFNQATINRLIHPLRIEPLSELFTALTDQMERNRKSHSFNFARSYVKEAGGFRELLYHKTAESLLIEVNRMSETLVKKESVVSIARTLNYFVRDKNYGYVDALRNAKDAIAFKEILIRALRTAQTRKAAGEPVHIPSSIEIQEVMEIAEKENLDDLKLSISLLALSYITQ